MKLSEKERRFLTALSREQNQTGCRGPGHDLLRKHVYPNARLAGPDSLVFAYEAVPLTSLLLKDFTDLRTGKERHYAKVAPVFFAHPPPANIRVAQIRSDIRPRILAGIDAALRHLPFKAGQDDFRAVVLEPAADQDLA
jgi:hypothetical protein